MPAQWPTRAGMPGVTWNWNSFPPPPLFPLLPFSALALEVDIHGRRVRLRVGERDATSKVLPGTLLPRVHWQKELEGEPRSEAASLVSMARAPAIVHTAARPRSQASISLTSWAPARGRYTMLDARCSMLDTRCLMHDTGSMYCRYLRYRAAYARSSPVPCVAPRGGQPDSEPATFTVRTTTPPHRTTPHRPRHHPAPYLPRAAAAGMAAAPERRVRVVFCGRSRCVGVNHTYVWAYSLMQTFTVLSSIRISALIQGQDRIAI
ncbi:hypothetical protein EVG20_g10493 [Dentipellis fragilis]|uniref:Uncharacterized protein n=1 Tax=Dentipellis fragilis TaxID=205917 RepID=A0A4Y9XS41_9AGAM|nr:hypothetical protein EVG20_g10493 [Dentipellis fragilis]